MSNDIDWLEIGLAFSGGLAIFIFGVELLAASLRTMHGGRFQKLLQRSSTNRLAGLGSGTLATVVLDSSSVVIILLVTIVDAGLISFVNALPVILGSNIGTTLSSQIFAWNVDAYAPVLLVGGLLWKALARSDAARARATVLIGIGLVLFALFVMGAAVEPLKENEAIVAWLRRLEAPLLGVAAGAAVTVALQSSSAMMGIVITLAGGGLISLPAGIAIMLGAEIGTCADTLVATIGRSRAAVKAGLFHLLFNVATVAAGIALMGPLVAFGQATAGEAAQQIANTHVLFNVAGALVVLPLVGLIARGLEWLVPERGDGGAQSGRALAN